MEILSMLMRRVVVLLIALSITGTAFAADSSDLQVGTLKPGATLSVERVIEDGKALVSVVDEKENAVFGLGAGDFSVTQFGRKADIHSVQPLSETTEVPRRIVMVLDNSYSMKERNAVGALLAGLDELLKNVRPVDQVDMIVFDNFKRMSIGPYYMSVGMLHSSDPGELRAFAESAYHDKIAGKTVLYDAMLAGIELIKKMPVDEPRFMVVFSDGADLNSSHDEYYVWSMAKRIKGFNAYAIDYMPGKHPDKFLSQFTASYNGGIWKVKNAGELVRIFREVASDMQHYYVINYGFPPTGSLAVAPSAIKLDEVRISAGAPKTSLDVSGLTLTSSVDSLYGIAGWKVNVTSAGGSIASLEGEGEPAPELTLPLAGADLRAIAAGGELTVKMDIRDNKGQSLELTAPPVSVELARSSADMSVSPAVLKFDELSVSGGAPRIKADTPELTVRPAVVSAYGIASWKLSVTNAAGGVAELAGSGEPSPEIKVELPSGDMQALALGGPLSVRMVLRDNKGHEMKVDAGPVEPELITTSAGVQTVQKEVTIEEVRTIDSSPMLNQVYFDEDSSEIPARYVRLAGPAATQGFGEQRFRDAMEKYYQILNVVGGRLADHPEATVTLVGCNDNTGRESGNRKLSTRRAEAVSDYLQTVWNIAPGRIKVEARNLPAMPSASRLEEGRQENRRVEILSDVPAIIAPIQSTYFTNRLDTPSLRVRPEVASPYGVASWKLTAANGFGTLAELNDEGMPADEIGIPLEDAGPKTLATGGDIRVKMEFLDTKGRIIPVAAAPVRVNFIQTSQRLAQKQGMTVQEKYALILFDFDKDTIDARNKDIVNGIAARINALPDAAVDIVGHTDNIGKESYNLKLSERRALATYRLLSAAVGGDAGGRIRYWGVGPDSPLNDNLSPEARSFNRTVTITLEYQSTE